MFNFADALIQWQFKHGRHHLPWQQKQTPYRVWVSEIMLQQTQVDTVIPYFTRFMQHFPSLKNLAEANLDEVLQLWTGLGYYARARNLHKTALIVYTQYAGLFPAELSKLMDLPGIGRSTAGAILSLGMQQSAPILDGNVRRVLMRYYALPGLSNAPKIQKILWEYAEKLTPTAQAHVYNQALMDLGATICTQHQPQCPECPLQTECKAYRAGTPAQYPSAKPARKQQKSAQWLVVMDAQERLLLEKRPAHGIWGGLWSFPQCGSEIDAVHYLQHQFGLVTKLKTRLKPFKHVFSHYTLHLQPILLELVKLQPQVREHATMLQWCSPGQPLTGGFPAPVMKFIQQLTLKTTEILL